MLTGECVDGSICSMPVTRPTSRLPMGVDDGKLWAHCMQAIGRDSMDHTGALQGSFPGPSCPRASMRTARMMHARGTSALAAADRCCVLGAWPAHPPHDCGRCRTEVACLASDGDAAATTSTARRVTDASEAQPDPSYEAGGQWSSRHYRKAQARCRRSLGIGRHDAPCLLMFDAQTHVACFSQKTVFDGTFEAALKLQP